MTTLTINHLTVIQCLILVLTLSLLVVQLLVPKKRSMHILFAIFCGSVAIATSQKLAGESLGAWQYVIGLGACATCNIYWLLARTMFRSTSAINIHHIGFAVLLGGLMMVKQGYLFVDSVWTVDAALQHTLTGVLHEAITMLSSVVLILAVWEGLRGFREANHQHKAQRIMYVAMLCTAIAVTKFSTVSYASQPELAMIIVAYVTFAVIALTQILILWITHTREQSERIMQQPVTPQTGASSKSASNPLSAQPATTVTAAVPNDAERKLAEQISEFLAANYLQTNLKVADVARAFEVSEYRVSRVLKQYYQAKNFNHYINQIRITHAKTLLADPASQSWPVLVVGLESGFASVGPFTRAFKQFTGVTPAQYRQQQVSSA